MIKISREVLCSLLSYGVKQKPLPPRKKKKHHNTLFFSFRTQQTSTFVMFIFEIRFNLQKAPLCRASHARLNLRHKEENINRPGVLVIIQNGPQRKAKRGKKNITKRVDKKETDD